MGKACSGRVGVRKETTLALLSSLVDSHPLSWALIDSRVFSSTLMPVMCFHPISCAWALKRGVGWGTRRWHSAQFASVHELHGDWRRILSNNSFTSMYNLFEPPVHAIYKIISCRSLCLRKEAKFGSARRILSVPFILIPVRIVWKGEWPPLPFWRIVILVPGRALGRCGISLRTRRGWSWGARRKRRRSPRTRSSAAPQTCACSPRMQPRATRSRLQIRTTLCGRNGQRKEITCEQLGLCKSDITGVVLKPWESQSFIFDSTALSRNREPAAFPGFESLDSGFFLSLVKGRATWHFSLPNKTAVKTRYFEVPRTRKEIRNGGVSKLPSNHQVTDNEGESAWLRNSGDFELAEFEIARFDCTSIQSSAERLSTFYWTERRLYSRESARRLPPHCQGVHSMGCVKTTLANTIL